MYIGNKKMNEVLVILIAMFTFFTTIFGNVMNVSADTGIEFGLINHNEVIEVDTEFELELIKNDSELQV